MHGLLGDGLPRGGLLARRGSQPRGYGPSATGETHYDWIMRRLRGAFNEASRYRGMEWNRDTFSAPKVQPGAYTGSLLPWSRPEIDEGGGPAVPGLLSEAGEDLEYGLLHSMPGAGWADPYEIARLALLFAGTGVAASGIGRGATAGGAVLGQNVWHGGPNKWKPEPGFPQGRPRLDKIGTGAGAQAYGHGFYSADAKAVGQSYGTTIKGPREAVVDEDTSFDVAAFLGDDIGEHAADRSSQINHKGSTIEYLFDDGSMLEMDASGAVTPYGKSTASLYHLDLDDKDIAKYLDWDALLSEQPEGVRAALMKLANDPPPEYDSFDHLAIAAMRGEHPRNKSYEPTGKEIYEDLASFNLRSSGYGSDHAKAASEALRRAGIPGLKYYDGFSRIGSPQSVANTRQKLMKAQERLSAWQNSDEAVAGQQLEMLQKEIARLEKYLGQQLAEPGTRNYVTWDQDVLDRVKILERDGQPILSSSGPPLGLLQAWDQFTGDRS